MNFNNTGQIQIQDMLADNPMKLPGLGDLLIKEYNRQEVGDIKKIDVGTKLKIWSSKFNSEQVVTVVYRRLNVIFFQYENGEEDWLPTGSYIIEKAIIVKNRQ